MLKIPDASAFGGTCDIPEKITQSEMVGGDEEPGVRGLSSIGTTIHPHASRHARDGQIGRRGTDAARAVGTGGTADVEPARRLSGWGTVPVFCGLDGSDRQGRAATQRTTAAAGGPGQCRGDR